MEKYYEIDEAVLMNSIHDITEVELKELISDENMYIRTMTNVCPTSFLTLLVYSECFYKSIYCII